MADLTSKYRDKNLRDVSMQACLKAIEKGYIDYPENYIVGKFTDFFDIQGGTQPPKSKFVYTEEMGFIRFLQIRDFSSENTLTYIPEDSKNKLCKEQDILLGRYGASVGKILTGKSGAYNVACAKVIILDNNKVDQQYLFYLLHSTTIQDYIKNISRSAQGGFNKGDLNKIELVIPKIEWQRKLLAVLQEIDAFLVENKEIDFTKYKEEFIKYLIALFRNQLNVIKQIEELTNQHDSQKSLLKQLRQSILQEAVQGKLVPQDASDEPAEQLLQRIKAEKAQLIKEGKLKKEKELPPVSEDEIPFELPKGWVWCKLGEIINLTSGVTLGKSYKEELISVPYLRVANVQRGFVDITHLKQLAVPKSEIEKYALKKGDLVMIEGGDWDKVGRCAIWNGEIEPCIHQNHIFRLRFYGNISHYWAELFLNSPVARRYFESCSKQTTNLASINKTQLTNTLVALPPISLQHQIVEKVNQLIKHVNELELQLQQSIEQSQQLLQGILREAFTGSQKEYAENEMLTMAAEE